MSAYGGVPVHISAYILDTEQGPNSCCGGDQVRGGPARTDRVMTNRVSLSERIMAR